MPEADDEKIKSAPKQVERGTSPLNLPSKWETFRRAALPEEQKNKKVLLYGLGVVLALLAVLAPSVFFQPPTATLRVDGVTYRLAIANTEAKRAQGLGGRATLATDEGMVFVFENTVEECFWMKDMKLPIDIIWLDEAKRVVYIEHNVSPKSYPKSYCPPTPAKYVIELVAGQAKAAGLTVGQKLSF